MHTHNSFCSLSYLLPPWRRPSQLLHRLALAARH
jgi:hypothetical protein